MENEGSSKFVTVGLGAVSLVSGTLSICAMKILPVNDAWVIAAGFNILALGSAVCVGAASVVEADEHRKRQDHHAALDSKITGPTII